MQSFLTKTKPQILLVTAFFTVLIISVVPGSVNGAAEMQKAEIGPHEYIIAGQWQATRGDVIYWYLEGEVSLLMEITVFPESELAPFKAGETFMNYYDGFSMSEEVDGIRLPFDDTWLLVFYNDMEYSDIVVRYLVGCSVGAAEMQEAEIGPHEYIIAGQWQATRGEIIYWYLEGEEAFGTEIAVFPESELAPFEAGETFMNYYDGFASREKVDGIRLPIDDTWLLVFYNDMDYSDIVVRYLVGCSVGVSVPTTTPKTTPVATCTPTTITVTITETTTDKTMSEVTLPAILVSIIFAILIQVSNRRKN
ncbi:MAG: hypothetical protein ACE5R6_21080 [Candidatus Heimdallarchaeota archaeon]